MAARYSAQPTWHACLPTLVASAATRGRVGRRAEAGGEEFDLAREVARVLLVPRRPPARRSRRYFRPAGGSRQPLAGSRERFQSIHGLPCTRGATEPADSPSGTLRPPHLHRASAHPGRHEARLRPHRDAGGRAQGPPWPAGPGWPLRGGGPAPLSRQRSFMPRPPRARARRAPRRRRHRHVLVSAWPDPVRLAGGRGPCVARGRAARRALGSRLAGAAGA